MCVLDNNNGRNDTPQLSQSTKYDKLILTSDLRTPEQLVQECRGRHHQLTRLREAEQINKLTLECLYLIPSGSTYCQADRMTR